MKFKIEHETDNEEEYNAIMSIIACYDVLRALKPPTKQEEK